MSEREARKIAAEYLRPLNQGLESIGQRPTSRNYVETTYTCRHAADGQRARRTDYAGYQQLPDAGFREPVPSRSDALSVQRYFSEHGTSNLSHESRDKIRDVLSSVLGSAVEYGLLVKNPVEGVRLPPTRGAEADQTILYPRAVRCSLTRIPEPYATMVFVAIYTGLRVSELAACGMT